VQATQRLRDNIAAANQLKPVALSDTQIEQILAFLKSLTDPRSRHLKALIPDRVPSDLPLTD